MRPSRPANSRCAVSRRPLPSSASSMRPLLPPARRTASRALAIFRLTPQGEATPPKLSSRRDRLAAGVVQRPPDCGRRVAGGPFALRARHAERPGRLHADVRPRRDRVEPVPCLDPARTCARRLRASAVRHLTPGAPRSRRPMAAVLSERAVHRHRPEAPRSRRPDPRPLRRPVLVGRGVGGAAARPDLALPDARGRAALARPGERLGPRGQCSRPQFLRDLSRPRPTLELLGRLCPPRGASRPGCERAPRRTAGPDGFAYLVLARELSRLLLVCANERPHSRLGDANGWLRLPSGPIPPRLGSALHTLLSLSQLPAADGERLRDQPAHRGRPGGSRRRPASD